MAYCDVPGMDLTSRAFKKANAIAPYEPAAKKAKKTPSNASAGPSGVPISAAVDGMLSLLFILTIR